MEDSSLAFVCVAPLTRSRGEEILARSSTVAVRPDFSVPSCPAGTRTFTSQFQGKTWATSRSFFSGSALSSVRFAQVGHDAAFHGRNDWSEEFEDADLVRCKKTTGGRFGKAPSAPKDSPAPEQPQVPPGVRDGLPEFYIFVRTNRAKVWYPVGSFLGDNSARVLTNAMRTNWGRKLYGGTLNRRIASAVFRDKEKLLTPVLQKFSALRKYKDDLEFGFRVRMKDFDDGGMQVITEPEPSLIEKVQSFFKPKPKPSESEEEDDE